MTLTPDLPDSSSQILGLQVGITATGWFGLVFEAKSYVAQVGLMFRSSRFRRLCSESCCVQEIWRAKIFYSSQHLQEDQRTF